MKHLWYLIGVLAALIVLAVVVRGPQEAAAPAPTESPAPTPEPSVSVSPTPKAVSKPRATPKPPVPTYGEIAGLYEGRRVQFDVFCQAFPVESTFIDGTQVLLDNRSPDDRVVSIGGIQHGLRSFGWKVVTMTAPELPATLAIDCGTAKKVGKIVIEPSATPTPEPLPTPASSSDPLVSPSPDASPVASESPMVM